MKVGLSVIFQNPGNRDADRDVYRMDLGFAEMAESLGFDSVWGVEHHFTDYTMCPDVLQYLTYMAGRSSRVGLGSMVVVLPWHDPVRVAEQVCMLDHISNGRLILGIGRGLARVEFEGFRLDMGESRARFTEYAELLLTALETGYCEYDGQFIRQPRREIRPRPFKSFRGRTYAAAVSPESARIMARLGVGILIIPQKPWEAVAKELEEYKTLYRQMNGVDAQSTIAGGWTFCDEDPDCAREGAEKYIQAYYHTVLRHYEMAGEHFQATNGYEYYGKMAEMVQKLGADKMAEYFMHLQVWGTPEQCYEKIVGIRDRVNADTFVAVFSYGGMPAVMAERSLRLFVKKVLPEVRRLGGETERTLRSAAAQF